MTIRKLFIYISAFILSLTSIRAVRAENNQPPVKAEAVNDIEIFAVPILSADIPCHIETNGEQISKHNIRAYIMPPQEVKSRPVCILAKTINAASGTETYGEFYIDDAIHVSDKLKLAAQVIDIAEQRNSLVAVKIASFHTKVKSEALSVFRNFDLEIWVLPNPLINRNSVVLRRLFYVDGDKKKDEKNVFLTKTNALILSSSLMKAQRVQSNVEKTKEDILYIINK